MGGAAASVDGEAGAAAGVVGAIGAVCADATDDAAGVLATGVGVEIVGPNYGICTAKASRPVALLLVSTRPAHQPTSWWGALALRQLAPLLSSRWSALLVLAGSAAQQRQAHMVTMLLEN